jgi:hypothetical protein
VVSRRRYAIAPPHTLLIRLKMLSMGSLVLGRNLGDGTGAIRTRDLPRRRRKSLCLKALCSKVFAIAFHRLT